MFSRTLISLARNNGKFCAKFHNSHKISQVMHYCTTGTKSFKPKDDGVVTINVKEFEKYIDSLVDKKFEKSNIVLDKSKDSYVRMIGIGAGVALGIFANPVLGAAVSMFAMIVLL